MGLRFGFWKIGFGVFGLTVCEVLGFCLSDFLVLAFVRFVVYSFGCFWIRGFALDVLRFGFECFRVWG